MSDAAVTNCPSITLTDASSESIEFSTAVISASVAAEAVSACNALTDASSESTEFSSASISPALVERDVDNPSTCLIFNKSAI